MNWETHELWYLIYKLLTKARKTTCYVNQGPHFTPLSLKLPGPGEANQPLRRFAICVLGGGGMTGMSSMLTSSTSESELSGSQHIWWNATPLPRVYTREKGISDLGSFGARGGGSRLNPNVRRERVESQASEAHALNIGGPRLPAPLGDNRGALSPLPSPP